MPKAYTTETFIKKLNDKYGDIYVNEYNKTNLVYKKSNEKMQLQCDKGHIFSIRPNDLLNGHGCKECVISKSIIRLLSDTKTFIKKAEDKHGDLYSYLEVDYVDCETNICIICKIHGKFYQTPHKHLSGSGCKKCGIILVHNLQRKKTEEFIEESKQKHGELYDYSKTDYKTNKTDVIIICKKHREFQQNPKNHVNGAGCPLCAIEQLSIIKTKTTEDFIIEAKQKHKDKYDYSKVVYINCETPICIICKIHGEFYQIPSSHLINGGCNKCGILITTQKNTKKQSIYIEEVKQIHGDKYDYSKVIYINCETKINIICKIHGNFYQTPNMHKNDKNGCPLCTNKTEGKLYETLKKSYPTLVTQFKQEWCKKISYLPFDFCIPELKIIIELDGLQHFKQVSNWSSPEEQLENDIYKQKCAIENGYNLIRLLQEDVFNDSYDWNKELCQAIENVKNKCEPKNVYLCKNDEYKYYN
jgi:very-short-patch-repair endonuclease